MARIITYENGDIMVWNGRAEIHYHRTKIVNILDLPNATEVEIKKLKHNPHDQELISSIQQREKALK